MITYKVGDRFKLRESEQIFPYQRKLLYEIIEATDDVVILACSAGDLFEYSPEEFRELMEDTLEHVDDVPRET